MYSKFSFYVIFLRFTLGTAQIGYGEVSCTHLERWNTHPRGCTPSVEACLVTCREGCNQRQGAYHFDKQVVYGTGRYLTNSSLCGAAYHDYRVPSYAFRTNVWYIKQCGEVQKYLPSIRQNIKSHFVESSDCSFTFITPFFTEEILDIATLNYKYFYQGNDTFIQSCQISDRVLGLDYFFYMPESDRKNSIRQSAGWQEVQWIKPTLQPGGFLCDVHRNDYADVMSLAMSSNADFVPEQWTLTTSINENVVIKFTQRDPYATPTTVLWRKDQIELSSFPNIKISQNKSGHFLEIVNVDIGHGGIYSLQFADDWETQGITRLIVRKCPKNYYGPVCSRVCPTCRNGGVCHDVMGVCICPPGFNGVNCESKCKSGYFGRNCSLSCASSAHAIGNSCKGALICLQDPYGCSCSAEYKGLACNEKRLPSACDQQKVAVCNQRHQKFENCARVKAYRDCLTTIASCPVEQVDKMIRRVMDLNLFNCSPFDIDKDEAIESTCQKPLQERSLELHERSLVVLEEMENRMLEEREFAMQFQGKVLQQLERIANSVFSEDNLPWKNDNYDIHSNDQDQENKTD